MPKQHSKDAGGSHKGERNKARTQPLDVPPQSARLGRTCFLQDRADAWQLDSGPKWGSAASHESLKGPLDVERPASVYRLRLVTVATWTWTVQPTADLGAARPGPDLEAGGQ
jgi:hypothetical protein